MADNPFEPIPTSTPTAFADDAGPFTVEGMLRDSWRLTLANFLPLFLASFLTTGVGAIVGFVVGLPAGIVGAIATEMLAKEMDPQLAEALTSIMTQLITFPINAAVGAAISWVPLVVALDVVRGVEPSFQRIFDRTDRILPFIGTVLLLQLATLAGYLCLIIPGIVAALGLYLSSFYALDKRLAPVAALQASWAAMDGYKMTMFFASLAMSAIGIIGIIFTCGLGALVVLPWFQVCLAYAYQRISRSSADQIPGQA